jgi:hypothetical protein
MTLLLTKTTRLLVERLLVKASTSKLILPLN